MLSQLLIVLMLFTCTPAPTVPGECYETQELYPGKISSANMTNTTKMRAREQGIYCDMFTYSCCTVITEYKMRTVAGEWGSVVVASYESAVAIIDSGQLYPDLIPTTVISAVEASVDYSVELNKNSLTSLALSGSRLTCDENNSQYSLISQYMQPAVDRMADTLYALIRGLKILKSAYATILEYPLSETCTRALIRNGVPTTSDLQNNNCQVCTGDTAAYRTCSNTCAMVVSGCYSELINVTQLTQTLLRTLDGIYYNLQLQIQDDYMAKLRFMETSYPECFSSDLQEDVEEDNEDNDAGDVASGDGDYFTETLQLGAARLEEGIRDACSGSTSNSNCFTSNGITAADSTPAINFTRDAQKINMQIQLGARNQEVAAMEDKLKSMIAVFAGNGSTEGSATAAPEEGRLGDTDSGSMGTAVWVTGVLVAGWWSLYQ